MKKNPVILRYMSIHWSSDKKIKTIDGVLNFKETISYIFC